MVAEPVIPGIVVLIHSQYCGFGIWNCDGICSRSWDAETSARWAHSKDDLYSLSRRALRWTQRWQDSRKPWEQLVSRSRNRSQRTWESGSQSRSHLAKTLTTGISHFTDSRVHSILSILFAENSETIAQCWWRLHNSNSSETLLYLLTMLTQKVAWTVVRKVGNNGFNAYRQL